MISGLTVIRGGTTSLRDVSVRIRPGCVTGLLGPSGSGKTTLLRSIVGVQRITSGTVTVLGLEAGAPPLRRRVGYMTQAHSVYADLTVGENLRFFARVLGIGEEQARAAAESVSLGAFMGRIVGTLSGGERARVSLAAALLGAPDVLVLDEPTVGLDPVLRRDLWETFHRLAAAGTTALVSSHVMDEAKRCDELVLMRLGEVLAQGTPASLRDASGQDDLDATFLELIERVSPA